MGTEITLSFTALRAQLENEKSSLFKIDENIKKIVQTGSGRFPNDRFNPAGEYARGNRAGGRNSFSEGGNNYNKNEEHFGKRKQETKTVFSRLSGKFHDSDGEEEMSVSGPAPVVKRVKMPSAVSKELPTRAAVLRAQGGDEQARTRNRRMFGSLLGTLQKFKQEEIVLQNKEEKKAQVERKIEEAARLEKEREHKERKTLFAEREHKKSMIKALEAKMARVAEFERWEESQKHLGNFILTKAKPLLYWLPNKMTDAANEKLVSSRKFHEKFMSKKREELQDELQRIEQRVLRPRGPWAKENKPTDNSHNDSQLSLNDSQQSLNDSINETVKQEDGGKKRDKFAMDVDHDDSDDDRHDEVEVKVEDAVMETTVEVTKEAKEKDTEPSVQLEESKIKSTVTTREQQKVEEESSIVEVEAEAKVSKPEAPSSDETPKLPETEINGEEETKNVQDLDPKPVETQTLENHPQ